MPNLHPFFVHFPIALLTVGLVTDLWTLVRHDRTPANVGWWLQAAGTIGLLAAVGTGIFAGHSVAIPEAARGTFDAHQQGAFISAAIFSGLALWRLAVRGNIKGRRGAMFLILYAVGVGAVIFTGWHAGKMVFEYGVGVSGSAIR